MYHELLERLALILAKTEGWEIEDIHGNNPRMKVYLKWRQPAWVKSIIIWKNKRLNSGT